MDATPTRKEQLALDLWNIAHDRVSRSPLTWDNMAPSEMYAVNEIFNRISEYEAPPVNPEPDYSRIAGQLSDAQWSALLRVSEASNNERPGYVQGRGDGVSRATLNALINRGLITFGGYWYTTTDLGESVSNID